jgi:hypothetical protein
MTRWANRGRAPAASKPELARRARQRLRPQLFSRNPKLDDDLLDEIETAC